MEAELTEDLVNFLSLRFFLKESNLRVTKSSDTWGRDCRSVQSNGGNQLYYNKNILTLERFYLNLRPFPTTSYLGSGRRIVLVTTDTALTNRRSRWNSTTPNSWFNDFIAETITYHSITPRQKVANPFLWVRQHFFHYWFGKSRYSCLLPLGPMLQHRLTP